MQPTFAKSPETTVFWPKTAVSGQNLQVLVENCGFWF